MLRLGCLYDKKTFAVSSAASSAELIQQMQSLLVSTEILDSEQGIRCNHCDEGKIAEIESLGYYLGAYKDVDAAFGKVPDRSGFECLALRCIAVQPCDSCLRKNCRELFLYLLGSGPKVYDRS